MARGKMSSKTSPREALEGGGAGETNTYDRCSNFAASIKRLWCPLLLLFCLLQIVFLNRLLLELFSFNVFEVHLELYSQLLTVAIGELLTSILVCLILAFCITRINVKILLLLGMILFGITCLLSKASVLITDSKMFYQFFLGTHIIKGFAGTLAKVSIYSICLACYELSDGIMLALLLCMDTLGRASSILLSALLPEAMMTGILVAGTCCLAMVPFIIFMVPVDRSFSEKMVKAPRQPCHKLSVLSFCIGTFTTLCLYICCGFRRILIMDRLFGFPDYSPNILDLYGLSSALPFAAAVLIFGTLWAKGIHPAYGMATAHVSFVIGLAMLGRMPWAIDSRCMTLAFVGLIFMGFGQATIVPFLYQTKMLFFNKRTTKVVTASGTIGSVLVAIQDISQLLDYVIRFSQFQVNVGEYSLGLLWPSVFCGFILIVLTVLTVPQLRLCRKAQPITEETVELNATPAV